MKVHLFIPDDGTLVSLASWPERSKGFSVLRAMKAALVSHGYDGDVIAVPPGTLWIVDREARHWMDVEAFCGDGVTLTCRKADQDTESSFCRIPIIVVDVEIVDLDAMRERDAA